MKTYAIPVLTGVLLGVAARLYYMSAGWHRFPTAPHGRVIHLLLGFLASTLGGLSVPAIYTANVTAGVFLGLGTTQFHTMRELERRALKSLDEVEPVPRGPAYIEGMVMAFEARSYLVFAIAFATTLFSLLVHPLAGLAAGVAAVLLLRPLVAGPTFRDGVEIERVDWQMRDGRIAVDGRLFDRADPAPPDEAVAYRFTPTRPLLRTALRYPGQRQALLHEICRACDCFTGGANQPRLFYAEEDDRAYIVLRPRRVPDLRRFARHMPVLEAASADATVDRGAAGGR